VSPTHHHRQHPVDLLPLPQSHIVAIQHSTGGTPTTWTLTRLLLALPPLPGHHTSVSPMALPLAVLFTLLCQAHHVHSPQHRALRPCRNNRNTIISMVWVLLAVIGKTVPPRTALTLSPETHL